MTLNVLNRRTRSAAAVLGVALFVVAPAAHAQSVTNPADHPAPVTVKIDGQTYHDGLDTLPGYDDEACTPIPNVQYDFASDQIQYYSSDGELLDTAHWTEWSRISSYETWQAQQHAPTPTPTPTSTSTATATPLPSSNATTSPSTTNSATTSPSTTSPSTTSSTTTKSPSTKSSTTKSSTTKSSTTKSPSSPSTTSSTSKEATSSSADKSDTSTASPTNDSTATNDAATAAPAAHGASADAAGTAVPAGSTAPAAGAATNTPGAVAVSSTQRPETTKFKLASQQLGAAPADTRLAGVGILAAIFGVAGLGLMFRGIARRQGFGRPH